MYSDSIKRGYLNKDFHIFHLNGIINETIGFHHHDFNKIVILLDGTVTYHVEGKNYNLVPNDILLIGAHEVHKPSMSSKNYHRLVIWIDTSFLTSIDKDFSYAFEKCRHDGIHLLKVPQKRQDEINSIVQHIIKENDCTEYGSSLFTKSLLINLLIIINRFYINGSCIDSESVNYDKMIWDIIKFINSNLEKELSIDYIASEFFINKYYLMHKFKKETGYTLYKYILEKKLSKSKDFLIQGISVQEIAQMLGFNDYSNFLRQFKKHFGMSPLSYKDSLSSNNTFYTRNMDE